MLQLSAGDVGGMDAGCTLVVPLPAPCSLKQLFGERGWGVVSSDAELRFFLIVALNCLSPASSCCT